LTVTIRAIEHQPLSTIYKKRRLKILKEYQQYLKSTSTDQKISSNTFFDTERVFQFISSYNTKNKQLILTHVNEILSSVALHSQTNLQENFLQPNFNLRQIPRMKCSFTVRKTADNRRKDVSFISFEEFVHVLDNHSHRHIDECRFLFQCATAARVSNTFNLKEYSEFVPKKCKKCLFFNAVILYMRIVSIILNLQKLKLICMRFLCCRKFYRVFKI